MLVHSYTNYASPYAIISDRHPLSPAVTVMSSYHCGALSSSIVTLFFLVPSAKTVLSGGFSNSATTTEDGFNSPGTHPLFTRAHPQSRLRPFRIDTIRQLSCVVCYLYSRWRTSLIGVANYIYKWPAEPGASLTASHITHLPTPTAALTSSPHSATGNPPCHLWHMYAARVLPHIPAGHRSGLCFKAHEYDFVRISRSQFAVLRKTSLWPYILSYVFFVFFHFAT